MAGRRCADLENSLVYAQLAQNSGSGPTMRDTNPMCTTTRTNKASAGTAIDATNIGLARAAMRGWTSVDGLKLNVAPTMLVCGAAKEHQALQVVTAATVPSTDATTNPYKGRMDVVADANIAANNWYLFADPAQFPCLIWGYLDGYEGPQFQAQEAWSTDGVEYRVLLYFGTGAVDWRGVFHNPGA
ncbi:MAG: Mu-like prophage major head subunit gpT family protein [Geminicoccaceae bacterium]